jgi:hypothetical protein
VIDKVAWPVHPDRRTGNTRPEKLVSELQKMGLVCEHSVTITHGRQNVLKKPLSAAFPGLDLPSARSSNGASLAVLSPVFLANLRSSAHWIDLYDDWSLAPDINPYHRALASYGYRRLRTRRAQAAVLTVNSRYMANLLRPLEPLIVPNGVDEDLAHIVTTGSDASRLLVLGHFFPGRTDFDLFTHIARRMEFDEVVVCAPGRSREMMAALTGLHSFIGSRLRVHDWMTSDTLATVIGARTVALVPNRVRDYTASQDLMKVYQLLALGVKVMCPRLIWPDAVDRTYGLLLEYGVNLDDVLADWIELGPPTPEWRGAFAADNSWATRAAYISAHLDTAHP